MAAPKSLKGLWRSATGYRRARTKPIRTDRSGMSAEDRLKRMNQKRLRRERAEIFDEVLFNGGLGISPFSRNAAGGGQQGGANGGAAGAGGPTGLGDDVNIPALDIPKTASIMRKPTISTVVKQLNVILAVTQQISAAMKSQQDALVQKAAIAREATKENAMESRNAEQLQPGNSDPAALEPISSSIDRLNTAIDDLSDMIEEKSDQNSLSNLLGGGSGILGSLSGGGKWGTILKTVLGTAAIAGTGYMAYSAMNSGNSLAALGNLPPTPTAASSNPPTATPSADNVSLSQPTPFSKTDDISSALLPALVSANERISTEKNISNADIQKMASPFIDNTLNSSILKLIPTAGNISASQSLDKIMQGDPGAAGVDPASGLSAPLSGIPALSTSISNDLYSKIFGIDPGADPQASRRMAMLRRGVDAAIAERIKPLIKPQAVGAPGDTTGAENSTSPSVTTTGTGGLTSTPTGAASTASPPASPPDASAETGTPVTTTGTGALAQTPSAAVSNPGTATSNATPLQTQINDPAIPSAADQANQSNDATQVSNTPAIPSFSNARDLMEEAWEKTSEGKARLENQELEVVGGYVNKKHPILEFLQETFAQEKEYKSPERKAFEKQQKLLADSERRKNFGYEGIHQLLKDAPAMLSQASGVGLENEALLPSMKPTAAKPGLVEGIGEVPSPDYPLFAQYSGSFYMGDFGG